MPGGAWEGALHIMACKSGPDSLHPEHCGAPGRHHQLQEVWALAAPA